MNEVILITIRGRSYASDIYNGFVKPRPLHESSQVSKVLSTEYI